MEREGLDVTKDGPLIRCKHCLKPFVKREDKDYWENFQAHQYYCQFGDKE